MQSKSSVLGLEQLSLMSVQPSPVATTKRVSAAAGKDSKLMVSVRDPLRFTFPKRATPTIA